MRREKGPRLRDIVNKYKSAMCHVFRGTTDIEECKFIVVIAVDKNNTGVNALALHLHIEIHGVHRMNTDVLKQSLWPVLDRRRDVIGPKWIHGVSQAVTICMEGATQCLR